MEINQKNTTEDQLKVLIGKLKEVDNLYLDKKQVLKELNRILTK